MQNELSLHNRSWWEGGLCPIPQQTEGGLQEEEQGHELYEWEPGVSRVPWIENAILRFPISNTT